jgi:hypothetical protein
MKRSSFSGDMFSPEKTSREGRETFEQVYCCTGKHKVKEKA